MYGSQMVGWRMAAMQRYLRRQNWSPEALRGVHQKPAGWRAGCFEETGVSQSGKTSRCSAMLRTFSPTLSCLADFWMEQCELKLNDAAAGAGPGERLGRSSPVKPTKVTLFTMIQFRKQHSRCKAILLSIVLSQRYCKAYFISLAVVKP